MQLSGIQDIGTHDSPDGLVLKVIFVLYVSQRIMVTMESKRLVSCSPKKGRRIRVRNACTRWLQFAADHIKPLYPGVACYIPLRGSLVHLLSSFLESKSLPDICKQVVTRCMRFGGDSGYLVSGYLEKKKIPDSHEQLVTCRQRP